MSSMAKVLRILSAVAVLAAGVACSSSDNGGAVNTPSSSASVNACATPSSEPSVAIDATSDIKFQPANVTVKPCQLVIWKVTGIVPHTATATSGATFDSGTLNQNDTYTQAFPTAGIIHYVCKIHPTMKGTITVAS